MTAAPTSATQVRRNEGQHPYRRRRNVEPSSRNTKSVRGVDWLAGKRKGFSHQRASDELRYSRRPAYTALADAVQWLSDNGYMLD